MRIRWWRQTILVVAFLIGLALLALWLPPLLGYEIGTGRVIAGVGAGLAGWLFASASRRRRVAAARADRPDRASDDPERGSR